VPLPRLRGLQVNAVGRRRHRQDQDIGLGPFFRPGQALPQAQDKNQKFRPRRQQPGQFGGAPVAAGEQDGLLFRSHGKPAFISKNVRMNITPENSGSL